MTAVVGIGTQVVVAAVLLFAGVQKLASPSQFRDTLRALGMHGVQGVAIGVAVAEIVTAVLLLSGLLKPLAFIMIAALGLTFGGAGFWARHRQVRVKCACLGPLSNGKLGSVQIAMVPLWLAAATGLFYLPTLGGPAGMTALVALNLLGGTAAASYLMWGKYGARRRAVIY